jgi:spore coat polysaccharide biosynthesis predicted glycosyltransferase SpsG
MGQSDPTRATSILVEALGLLPAGDFSVRVILDHRHPDFTEVSVRCAALPFPAEVLCHVEDMPGVLRWAHLVLTAAGSTCWELAYLGIPALTVLTAENQRGVATSLDERGVFPVLDRREKLSADAAALALLKVIENRELRERMSRAGRALVDGGGARRVVSALRCQGLGVTPGAGMGGIQP